MKTELGLSGAVVLGFIGSFYGYEGLALLLDAMPRIHSVNPRARLLLVGGGPQESALKQRAVELGIQDKVVFTGRVPHHDVPRYYDLVDVLVYPRLAMRLTDLVTPLKPLEAMAQGRLLVASDVGGHRELIEDGVTASCSRRATRLRLPRQVLALLDEQSWRWRAAARRFVETERNWAGSVNYRRCINASLQAEVMPRLSGWRSSRRYFPRSAGGGLFVGPGCSALRRSAADSRRAGSVVSAAGFCAGGNRAFVRRAAIGSRTASRRHPRFFSVPGASSGSTDFHGAGVPADDTAPEALTFAFNVIDAHFAYPDGYAATLWAAGCAFRSRSRCGNGGAAHVTRAGQRLVKALERARRVFSVSDSLKRHVVNLGRPATRSWSSAMGSTPLCSIASTVDRATNPPAAARRS